MKYNIPYKEQTVSKTITPYRIYFKQEDADQ